jgi:hypothetical protein
MTDDKFQQLVQNHPDIFQKAGDIEFSVGNGWFNIINTLCGLISYDNESAKRRLKYALEHPEAKIGESIADLEKKVKEAYDNLPTLVQVKEKFGSLRFYYDGGTNEIQNYVTFAESMTYRTCEECGAPGEARNDGWVKVLCDKHQKEREDRNGEGAYPSRKLKTAPKLTDEI